MVAKMDNKLVRIFLSSIIYTESQAFMWKYLCWPCKIPSFLLRGTDQEVPLNRDPKDKKNVKRRSGRNKTTVPSTTNGTFVHGTDKSKTDALSMQSEVATPPEPNDKDMTPEPKLNANGEIIYEHKELNMTNVVSEMDHNHEHGRKESKHEKNVPSLIIPSTHKIMAHSPEIELSHSSSNGARHIINVNLTDTPIAHNAISEIYPHFGKLLSGSNPD